MGNGCGLVKRTPSGGPVPCGRILMSMKRLVLWSVALAVLVAAVLVYLRAREASRGPEVCADAPRRTDPDTLTVRPSSFRILVFTRHTGYAHRSIPAAIAAL